MFLVDTDGCELRLFACLCILGFDQSGKVITQRAPAGVLRMCQYDHMAWLLQWPAQESQQWIWCNIQEDRGQQNSGACFPGIRTLLSWDCEMSERISGIWCSAHVGLIFQAQIHSKGHVGVLQNRMSCIMLNKNIVCCSLLEPVWPGSEENENKMKSMGKVPWWALWVSFACFLWSGWWSKSSSWSLTMIMPWTRVHWVSGWEDLIQTIMKVFSPSGNRSSLLVGKLRSSHHRNHCEQISCFEF